MKIAGLTNKQLDYWVPKAQGWVLKQVGIINCHSEMAWCKKDLSEPKPYRFIFCQEDYHPSTNWKQAGELVEKFKIVIGFVENEKSEWGAREAYKTSLNDMHFADTPTRAICLAVVASVYGEEVDE